MGIHNDPLRTGIRSQSALKEIEKFDNEAADAGSDAVDPFASSEFDGEVTSAGGAELDESSVILDSVRDPSQDSVDQAENWVSMATPQLRGRAELLFLDVNGQQRQQVVIRQGQSVFDPATNKSYPDLKAFMKDHPGAKVSAALPATVAAKIFATEPGTPERSDIVAGANVPQNVRALLDPSPAELETSSEPVTDQTVTEPEPELEADAAQPAPTPAPTTQCVPPTTTGTGSPPTTGTPPTGAVPPTPGAAPTTAASAGGKDEYTLDQADQDAKKIYEATEGGLTGWGTDEEAIFKTLEGKSPEQLNLLRKAYKDHYGKDMDEVVTGELDDDDRELKRGQALLKGDAGSAAEAEAAHIASEMNGFWGADEGASLSVLEKAKPEERKAIVEAYCKQNGGPDGKTPEEFFLSKMDEAFDDEEMDRARNLLKAGSASSPEEALKFESEASAGKIKDAMDGWGTDEDKIKNELEGKSKEQVDAIAEAYGRKFGDLGDGKSPEEYRKVLKDKLLAEAEGSQKDVFARWLNPPAEGDATAQAQASAEIIHDGVDGWGTDEDKIKKELEGKSKEQVDAIAEQYGRKYGDLGDGKSPEEYRKVLKDKLHDEADGKGQEDVFARWLNPVAEGDTKAQAEADAEKLRQAADGWGTDEEDIRKVLTGKSKAQIDEIAAAYKEKYGEDLRGMLDSELDGRDETELLKHLYDLGDIDPNAPGAEQERLRRIKEEHDAEGGFGIGLTSTVQFVAKGFDVKETDEYRFQKNYDEANDAIARGDTAEARRKVGFTDMDLESLQASKDTAAEWAAEAAALVAAGAVIIVSGGTATPLVIAIAAASAAAASAGTYAAVQGGAADSADVARHGAIGAVTGATFVIAPGGAAVASNVGKEVVIQGGKEIALQGGKQVAIRAGEQAVTTAGKEVVLASAEQAAIHGGEQVVIQGGSAAARNSIAQGAIGWAKVGGYSGAADGFTRTATDEATWREDGGVYRVFQGTLRGAVTGTVIGGGVGAGVTAWGRRGLSSAIPEGSTSHVDDPLDSGAAGYIDDAADGSAPAASGQLGSTANGADGAAGAADNGASAADGATGPTGPTDPTGGTGTAGGTGATSGTSAADNGATAADNTARSWSADDIRFRPPHKDLTPEEATAWTDMQRQLTEAAASGDRAAFKRAYRKIQREYHPDIAPSPGAQEISKEASRIYDEFDNYFSTLQKLADDPEAALAEFRATPSSKYNYASYKGQERAVAEWQARQAADGAGRGFNLDFSDLKLSNLKQRFSDWRTTREWTNNPEKTVKREFGAAKNVQDLNQRYAFLKQKLGATDNLTEEQLIRAYHQAMPMVAVKDLGKAMSLSELKTRLKRSIENAQKTGATDVEAQLVNAAKERAFVLGAEDLRGAKSLAELNSKYDALLAQAEGNPQLRQALLEARRAEVGGRAFGDFANATSEKQASEILNFYRGALKDADPALQRELTRLHGDTLTRLEPPAPFNPMEAASRSQAELSKLTPEQLKAFLPEGGELPVAFRDVASLHGFGEFAARRPELARTIADANLYFQVKPQLNRALDNAVAAEHARLGRALTRGEINRVGQQTFESFAKDFQTVVPTVRPHPTNPNFWVIERGPDSPSWIPQRTLRVRRNPDANGWSLDHNGATAAPALDTNGVFGNSNVPYLRPPQPGQLIVNGQPLKSLDGVLEFSAHGGPTGFTGASTREAALMAANEIRAAKVAGEPLDKVLLHACDQRDLRIFQGGSNAQDFKRLLNEELARTGDAPVTVLAAHRPGTIGNYGTQPSFLPRPVRGPDGKLKWFHPDQQTKFVEADRGALPNITAKQAAIGLGIAAGGTAYAGGAYYLYTEVMDP